MSGRSLTETGGVPLPVTILEMHLSADSLVMEATLVTLRKCSSISTGLCWSGKCCDSR